MSIRLNLAAHKVILRLRLTVFNVMPLTYSTPLSQDVSHAQLTTSIMKTLKDVTAKSHANYPDFSTEPTSANALKTEKDLLEYTTKSITPVTAPLTFPSGTVNIVSPAPLEPNSTPRKNNAITAQKVSKEIIQATLVSPDFD